MGASLSSPTVFDVVDHSNAHKQIRSRLLRCKDRRRTSFPELKKQPWIMPCKLKRFMKDHFPQASQLCSRCKLQSYVQALPSCRSSSWKRHVMCKYSAVSTAPVLQIAPALGLHLHFRQLGILRLPRRRQNSDKQTCCLGPKWTAFAGHAFHGIWEGCCCKALKVVCTSVTEGHIPEKASTTLCRIR